MDTPRPLTNQAPTRVFNSWKGEVQNLSMGVIYGAITILLYGAITILPAPTAKLMPNVLHCIPLDHISAAKRWDLDIWAAQDLHKASPKSGEVTSVLLKSTKTNRGGNSYEL